MAVPGPPAAWQELIFPTADAMLGPKLLHRDPESSMAPLLLDSEGSKEPGDSSNSLHSSVKDGEKG